MEVGVEGELGVWRRVESGVTSAVPSRQRAVPAEDVGVIDLLTRSCSDSTKAERQLGINRK